MKKFVKMSLVAAAIAFGSLTFTGCQEGDYDKAEIGYILLKEYIKKHEKDIPPELWEKLVKLDEAAVTGSELKALYDEVKAAVAAKEKEETPVVE